MGISPDRWHLVTACVLAAVLGLSACEEAVQPFADVPDGWVVYAILDPTADTQFVRVSRFFQYEGDAFAYAQNRDFTVPGLKVTLSGGGRQLEAVGGPSRRSGAGDFGPDLYIYRFVTTDSARLLEGEAYTLEVRQPDSPQFLLHGRTRIPYRPRVVGPSLVSQFPVGRFCLPVVDFSDSLRVIFQPQAAGRPAYWGGFEVSITVDYAENGTPKRAVFGPSRLFTSDDCSASGLLCYRIDAGAFASVLLGKGWNRSANPVYQTEPQCGSFNELSRAVQVRVTAADSALSTYLTLNDYRQFSLTDYRREYTNLRGSAQVAGIVGSVAYQNVPVRLDACTEYRLGLNGALAPLGCE